MHIQNGEEIGFKSRFREGPFAVPIKSMESEENNKRGKEEAFAVPPTLTCIMYINSTLLDWKK